MTKVYCESDECKYNNKEGVCDKEEISLEEIFKYEAPQCIHREYK